MNRVHQLSTKLRKTDEGVLNIFKDIIVIDEKGNSGVVPAIWGTEERQRQFIESRNVAKDGDLIVDRIRLPLIGIYSRRIGITEGVPAVFYDVTIYTLFQEDMNQIIEQVMMKFDNKKNCKLGSIVRDMGDASCEEIRVLRGYFSLTVEGIGTPVETHE